MRNSQKTLCLLIVCILTVFTMPLTDSRVFAQSPFISNVMQSLLDSTGEDYINARNAALELDEADFVDLVFLLNLADPISEERLVASALQTRKEQPAVTAEFDEHLQDSINNPMRGTASGKPKYIAWWPRDRFKFDPLAFEAHLKLDLPKGLKHSFSGRMGRKNPANIDRYLYLAKKFGVAFLFLIPDAARSVPHERERITPLIVTYHKYWRQRGHSYNGAIYFVISDFGNQLQLDAMHEIEAFERQHLPTEGLTPWSDGITDDDLNPISTAIFHARSAVAKAERGGQPVGVIDSLRAEHDQLIQQRDSDRKRLSLKKTWNRMAALTAKLEAKLSAPDTDESGPPPQE